MCTRRSCPHRPSAASHVVYGSRSTPASATPVAASIRNTPRTLYVFMGTEFIDLNFFKSFLRDPPSVGRRWLAEIPRSSDPDDQAFRRAARHFLTLPGVPLVGSGDTLTYSNPQQRIDYTIVFSGDRALFKTALETPDVGVFYDGHARYGRGPCFGPPGPPPPHGSNTGEHWNDGDRNHTGIFRMGWDFLSVPASEIETHGYHTDVADTVRYYRRIVPPPSVSNPVHITEDRSDPDMRQHFSRIRDTPLARIHPDIRSFVRNVHVPGELHAHPGEDEDHPHRHAQYVVLPAGAEHLRQTNFQARFLAHMGCSTHPHNSAVFREVVGPVVNDSKYAVFTTNLSFGWGAWLMVYHYLTYPFVSGGLPWGPHFAYAVDQTNTSLDQARSDWRLRAA
ncbi:MAG: hypothetical protein U0414_28830 [Polyangiaceae bacterium]